MCAIIGGMRSSRGGNLMSVNGGTRSSRGGLVSANGAMRSSNIERKKEVVSANGSKKIQSIRFCDIEFWFPLLKEPGTKSQFWTMTLESFFRSYHARGITLADQRILGWDELERAVGIPIQPLFERFPGFKHLFSEVDRIVIS